MAVYNGMPWIKEQIDTILNQNGVEVDLFVSIDPGSDETQIWLNTLVCVESRVKVVPVSETFGCAARNFYHLLRKVDLSRYEYIALADQDDIWAREKLYCACEALRSGDAVAYSGEVTAFWPDGREKKLKKAQPQRELDFLFEAAGPGCTYVFERDFALHLQKIVKNRFSQINRVLAHDWLFYALCRSQKFKWFIDSRSFVRYRQHGRNQLGANCGIYAMRTRMKMVDSGWYKSQFRQIAMLCSMEDVPLVKQIVADNIQQRLKSLIHVGKLRRRLRDRCVLAVLIILHRV